ncbi:MAG: redoxin domain-containing protein [Cyclobacteriaceae bacterium]|nr:redoxin domain-containing protein [Cyclobacteriaceae bacterium]
MSKPVVLVLFNSTCEHCQYELGQIKEQIADFNQVELVFLSSEPIAVTKHVAASFKPTANVDFVKINPENVYENFGTVRYPTILIYNAAGKLVKEFKGETKIEAILQYARQ